MVRQVNYAHIQEQALLAHAHEAHVTFVRVLRVPKNLHAKARVQVEEVGIRREVLVERLLDLETARSRFSPPIPTEFTSSEHP